MSFRDVGKNPLPPKVSLPPQKNRQRDPPPPAQVDPKVAVDQISEALKLHERDRNVLKEKIVQFQKMVNELHLMVDSDVMTPGDQWRLVLLHESFENCRIFRP